MSGQQIQPVAARDVAPDLYQDGPPPSDWGGGNNESVQEPKGPSIGRYLAAVNRFKWLVLVLTLAGLGGGYFASRFLDPEYEVQATILLEQGTGVRGGGANSGGGTATGVWMAGSCALVCHCRPSGD